MAKAKRNESALNNLVKARKRTRRIAIEVPSILLDYLETEAKRLGLTAKKLIVTILETHQSSDRRKQPITLAIAQGSGRLKTGRYEP